MFKIDKQRWREFWQNIIFQLIILMVGIFIAMIILAFLWLLYESNN